MGGASPGGRSTQITGSPSPPRCPPPMLVRLRPARRSQHSEQPGRGECARSESYPGSAAPSVGHGAERVNGHHAEDTLLVPSRKVHGRMAAPRVPHHIGSFRTNGVEDGRTRYAVVQPRNLAARQLSPLRRSRCPLYRLAHLATRARRVAAIVVSADSPAVWHTKLHN